MGLDSTAVAPVRKGRELLRLMVLLFQMLKTDFKLVVRNADWGESWFGAAGVVVI